MDIVKKIVINIIISFGIIMILIGLSSAIFAYTSIEDRYMQTFVFGSLLLSNLISSTMLTRKIKEKGLVYGALFGLIFCLMLYIITSLIFNNFAITNTLGIYLAVCVLSGTMGGIIGVNM